MVWFNVQESKALPLSLSVSQSLHLYPSLSRSLSLSLPKAFVRACATAEWDKNDLKNLENNILANEPSSASAARDFNHGTFPYSSKLKP